MSVRGVITEMKSTSGSETEFLIAGFVFLSKEKKPRK